MKKIIIFDLDGVLFNTATIADQAMRELYPSLTEKESLELLVGNLHEETEKIAHLRVKHTEEEKAQWREQYSKKKAGAAMFPGAKELLQHLHGAGVTLVLNTSAAENNSAPLLEKEGVRDLFDFLATKEVSKSKTEKFTVIKEKYAVNADDMLFITDTLGDLREADVSGVPTIAVLWGAHDKGYFTREEHPNLIAMVDSFDELMKVVQSR